MIQELHTTCVTISCNKCIISIYNLQLVDMIDKTYLEIFIFFQF